MGCMSSRQCYGLIGCCSAHASKVFSHLPNLVANRLEPHDTIKEAAEELTLGAKQVLPTHLFEISGRLAKLRNAIHLKKFTETAQVSFAKCCMPTCKGRANPALSAYNVAPTVLVVAQFSVYCAFTLSLAQFSVYCAFTLSLELPPNLLSSSWVVVFTSFAPLINLWSLFSSANSFDHRSSVMVIITTSSHVPDDDRGPLMLGIICSVFSLTTISVGLRIYVRFKTQAHGWDDYCIYIAWLMAVYQMVITGLLVHNGMGRHVEYIMPTLSKLNEVFTVMELGLFIGIGLVKLSVCIFILRLIHGTHPRTRITLFVTIFLNIIVTLVAFCIFALQCRPLKKRWQPETEGTCFTRRILRAILRVVGAMGCLTDFMCVAVPFFIFKGLQMGRAKKWSLILIMSLGIFTAATSIGKVVTVDLISNDFSWEAVSVTAWASLELLLGILVASLPTLRPLMVSAHQKTIHYWHSMFSSTPTIEGAYVKTHEFGGQRRTFERLEYGLDDTCSR